MSNEVTGRVLKWLTVSMPGAATTRRAASSRQPRPAGRSSKPPSDCSWSRAMRRPRCRRSRPRQESRSRPCTWPSRPRAASCARSGTCCFAGTKTTPRFPSEVGIAKCSRNPTPSASCDSNARNSRVAKLRIGGVIEVIHGAAPLDPDIDALWNRIQTEFHANQREIVKSLDDKRALRSGLDINRRGRHPLDAQPPRRLAAARRPARLDARAIRTVVRGRRLLTAPNTGQLMWSVSSVATAPGRMIRGDPPG